MTKIIFIFSFLFLSLCGYSQADPQFFMQTTPTSIPTISESGSFVNFTNNTGTASASQSATVSGANLLGDVTITAPTGFEVSLDNSSFASSKIAAHSGLILSGQPVTFYARVAAATGAGSYSGNIALTSSGAATVNVAVTATVSSGVSNDTVNINLWDGSLTAGFMHNPPWPKWNNVNLAVGQSTNQTSSALNYATGTASPITMSITETNHPDGSGTNSFYTDNGSGWAASTTTGISDTAFRTVLVFFDDGPDSVIFNNLPAANNNYTVIIGSSRNTATPRPQVIKCNGTTYAGGFDAQNNINNTIRFNNVVKDGSNKITIILTSPLQTSGNRSMFVNFIQLINNH